MSDDEKQPKLPPPVILPPPPGKPARDDMDQLVSQVDDGIRPARPADLLPAPAKILDRNVMDVQEHLDAHAAAGTPCSTLGIGVADYKGERAVNADDTLGELDETIPRPPEDTGLEGWTAQQRRH